MSRGRNGNKCCQGRNHQTLSTQQQQRRHSLPPRMTECSDNRSMVDLSAASLPSSTDLHLATEVDSSLDLCSVLESMLKGEPGGLALNRILAFLRKHTGWKTLGGTDVLDVCMMHSELLLFRVLHGEIVLFLKESSPSAGSPAVPIEQKSFSLFEPVLLPQLSSNDYFPVTVTHVATPHEIVLNMQTPETSQATSSLVSAMADFYSDHRARTALGRYVSIGCACAFFDASASESGGRRWRRGIVTDALGGDPVEVFDVDSGKKTPVPCEDLYVLLPKFHELPCQAINARLAMIHPLGGTGWDTAVSDRLVELSRDKVLMCSVVGSKGGILYVLLCDTNSLEDVWLNMMLVEEGLAMYYDDDCDVQR